MPLNSMTFLRDQQSALRAFGPTPKRDNDNLAGMAGWDSGSAVDSGDDEGDGDSTDSYQRETTEGDSEVDERRDFDGNAVPTSIAYQLPSPGWGSILPSPGAIKRNSASMDDGSSTSFFSPVETEFSRSSDGSSDLFETDSNASTEIIENSPQSPQRWRFALTIISRTIPLIIMALYLLRPSTLLTPISTPCVTIHTDLNTATSKTLWSLMTLVFPLYTFVPNHLLSYQQPKQEVQPSQVLIGPLLRTFGGELYYADVICNGFESGKRCLNAVKAASQAYEMIASNLTLQAPYALQMLQIDIQHVAGLLEEITGQDYFLEDFLFYSAEDKMRAQDPCCSDFMSDEITQMGCLYYL